MNRFYDVLIGDRKVRCQPKGHIRRHKDAEYCLPVIGDRVDLELLDSQEDGVDGYITGIKPRRNRLMRSTGDAHENEKVMAANLDRTLIVNAIERPGLDWSMLDRFLVTCELLDIDACIVINKVDLDPQKLERPEITTYTELGYPVVETSVKADIGMGRLRALIADGISLFAGTSGVGKSSLINWLVPRAKLTTGAVNQRSGAGRHTTTHSQLISLGGSGFLADSPGLRDFYPPRIEPDEVRFGYVEIREIQRDCRFSTCQHMDEPACAVREAVRAGEIASFRYANYHAMMVDMQQRDRNRY